MSKKEDFNNFRFDRLNWRKQSNQYLTMSRVSDDEKKIVVKVGESHILKTKFGYALILDASHVVFLKEWQVSDAYFGTEVLLQKDFFNVKEWGDFEDFEEIPENLYFEKCLMLQKARARLTRTGNLQTLSAGRYRKEEKEIFMAFVNEYGNKISYECSELISELKEDIAEFGGDMVVEVVTERRGGVTIYKDYNFIDNDKNTDFVLKDGESMQRMSATALLLLYEKENEIL